MAEFASLSERINALMRRVDELSKDHHDTAVEFKEYRHGIRAELQRILIDIDRITQARLLRDDELKLVNRQLELLKARLDQLDSERNTIKGGAKMLYWFWTGVAALLLIGIDALVRGYFH